MKKIFLLVTSLLLVTVFSINVSASKTNETIITSNIEYTPVITNVFSRTIVNVSGSSSDYSNTIYSRENVMDKLDEGELLLNTITFNDNDIVELKISIEITNYNPYKALCVTHSPLLLSVLNLYTIETNTNTSDIIILNYEETITLDYVIKLYLPYNTSMNFYIYNFNIYLV